VFVALTLAAVLPWAAIGAQGSGIPRITRFQLASGSFNTAERTVSARITTEGPAPTHFRASERQDLEGAVWRPMSTSPQITLSSGNGFKTVYLQVGVAAAVPSGSLPDTRSGSIVRTSSLIGVTMATLSPTVADTIVLGLPDLRAQVEMPASVQDGHFRNFEFDVTISNAGQSTPPGQVIHVYNSFVLNSLPMELVQVNFGPVRLVGDGCKITDTPTVECSLAPMGVNGAVTIHIRASTNNVLQPGQNEATHTLRTRIYGIAESDIANNWTDTPLKIVR
jgi:hypothetical protein